MIKAVKPLHVQESVSATLKLLISGLFVLWSGAVFMLIFCEIYFTSKVCFCVLMAQIVGSCCVVKIKNDIFVSLVGLFSKMMFLLITTILSVSFFYKT